MRSSLYLHDGVERADDEELLDVGIQPLQGHLVAVRLDVLQNLDKGAERRRVDELELLARKADVALGGVVGSEHFRAEFFGIARVDGARKLDLDLGRER